MNLTSSFLMGGQPDVHRYAQATFHEGTHRQAPGDSTPWRDVSSPLNRLRGWWLAPAAKGSMIAAWSVTLVLGAYCFFIQQDAKGTYLLNNVLLRTLHEETLRADANQERASELRELMKKRNVQEEIRNEEHLKAVKGFEEYDKTMKKGIINHELELSRERARADAVHERNRELVSELLGVRQELTRVKKENKTLSAELANLQKISRSLV
ncbi:hypothetical protein C3747_1g827 [Trypanosoma cruzi]|uniref:Uncharacterized protein n=2 Tax=Trypanosoma cruzi TaxID=5693 RepID=Q4DJY5_TRYCC|nr:hypothetical protein, conserved [Trypanosoma cruzi]EAN92854.1 hypothetical protein, conserved [Trypanosoma cruzi]PBJ73074.1 hypothetical protein BCY84_13887 [Trypanosoma cruzi cruzi]PWU84359.1 hypothetical protein C4B63_233g6 [Trypanosoma cruzi]PWV21798.1 hypothetical protein C3747_1g827 [Trypanosoma cruzi]|eukprot:XP_814705.1 hypothetical protein [Trypanosoma cruzi strain CL Brener]